MAATAQVTISSTLQGLPEGSTKHDSISMTNSSAVGLVVATTATTGYAAASLLGVAVPTSARFMIIVPPSTNAIPFRVQMTSSTAATTIGGMVFGATGASLVTVVGGSTYFTWTTGTTAVPLRLTIY